MPSATSILHRAADLIAGTGWTQRVPARDRKGNITDCCKPGVACYCAFGAVTAAEDEIDPEGDHADEVDDRLKRTLAKRGYHSSYVQWNDRPERTAAEVIALLREAAQ